jgi:putative glutamine amidotransferase
LLCAGAAHAEPRGWAIDMPGLGPIALFGATPEQAVHAYVRGLVSRDAFPGKRRELASFRDRMLASAKQARTLDELRADRPLSGIQLNSVEDLVGNEAHLAHRRAYASALDHAGIASVFFPPADSRRLITARLASISHLKLVGGEDIHPSMYGEPITHAHRDELNLVRDRYEAALVKQALALQLPIDGTCRGFQMMNVVRGGTLVQDIHADGLTTRAHAAPGFGVLKHPVVVADESALFRTVGTKRVRAVPSVHHEALGRIGAGLTVVGRAPDGVPEAIEGEDGRIRGYQFHAEVSPRSAFSRAIYASIAERARAYAARRSSVRAGR